MIKAINSGAAIGEGWGGGFNFDIEKSIIFFDTIVNNTIIQFFVCCGYFVV